MYKAVRGLGTRYPAAPQTGIAAAGVYLTFLLFTLQLTGWHFLMMS